MGLTKVDLKGLDDGTDGQIITYDASGNPVAVGPGTDGQVLTSTGAGSPPAFEDIPAKAALTGSTNNTITTVTGANAIQGEANLTFDGTNLGIGTASPSGASGTALEVNGGAGQARLVLKNNTSGSGSTDGQQIYSDGNTFGIQNREAGNLVFETNGGERLRIESDGKLKVGTTATPTQSGALNVFGIDDTTSQVSIRRGSADAGAPKIHFQKSRNTTDGSHTVVANGDALGQIMFAGNDGGGPENGARISAEIDGTPGGNDLPTRLVFSTTPDGSDTLAERVRIDSSGSVMINTTSSDGYSLKVSGAVKPAFFNFSGTSDEIGVKIRHARGGLSGFAGKAVQFCGNDNSEEGSIVIGTTSTAYNTSSDYRLKENEVAISNGITRLKQLKPYRFNFKKDKSTTVDGFFAHEVSSVVPEAISGVKDAMEAETRYEEGDSIPSGKAVGDPKTFSSTKIDAQQIDQSKLVPLLTAALQEAMTKIETLETKVAALEAG